MLIHDTWCYLPVACYFKLQTNSPNTTAQSTKENKHFRRYIFVTEVMWSECLPPVEDQLGLCQPEPVS